MAKGDWDKPHPFMPLTEDMCKCFRWKSDPIHIGGIKVVDTEPEPALNTGGSKGGTPCQIPCVLA